MKYKLFGLLLTVWLILLIMVYLPISKLVTVVFPLTVEYHYKLTAFLLSTAFSFVSSLYIGITELKNTKGSD
ncbi:hypothetical protein J7K52_00085 [Candidatus Bathyarchaeota archaeon]|nr:hypothetical protein [Candidatus Bathyarchaeota archaeon]